MTYCQGRVAPEVARLARTCRLPPSSVGALLTRAGGWLVAARLLRPDEAQEGFGILEPSPGGGVPDWLIWLPMPPRTSTAAYLRSAPVVGGKLSVRFIGDGLPVVVLALISQTQAIVVAVPMWDARASSWLHSIVERQHARLVIEPVGADNPTVLEGRFHLPRESARDLFEFECSVDDADRGHALRSAAVIALLVRSECEPHGRPAGQRAVVGVVTGNPADFGELAVLHRWAK